MEEELKVKVLAMLDEAKALAVEGKNDEAAKKIEEAKDEIKRPIGGGNNGRPNV